MVTGSLDDLVKVWKWRDEKLDLQWSLEGHQLGVVALDISHTLPIAASSSLDAHIHLWDLENGKQVNLEMQDLWIPGLWPFLLILSIWPQELTWEK